MTTPPIEPNAPEAAPATSAGTPVSENTAATPPASKAQPALSAELEREIDEVLRNATDSGASSGRRQGKKRREPAQAHAASAAINVGEKPKIRGPRVVQSGREHRSGKVVSVGPTDVFIEFGPKELGVLPRTQFKEDEALPQVGDTFEVVVDKFEPNESIYICSRPGAVQKADWEMLEVGQVVEARVTGVNKGGLELEVANHRAFMPASQVDVRRVADLSVYVGEKMKCTVTKVDRRGQGNITLSRREIMAEEKAEQIKKLKEELKEGDEREGVVRKIMPFGAFVDIGGIDGLLHISDLSHDRVQKVEDVVKEGQALRVKILKLDWENDRHSLGLKQLTTHPFAEAAKNFKEGDEVTGRVTKLTEFGAFVQLAEGVEGLVHISELSWKRVARTSDVVQPNQTVKVKILKIDPDARKISLSIKQTMSQPASDRARRGGKGKDFEDNRTPEEILKETPQLRRLREQAKAATKGKLRSGLGEGVLGMGLKDLKL